MDGERTPSYDPTGGRKTAVVVDPRPPAPTTPDASVLRDTLARTQLALELRTEELHRAEYELMESRERIRQLSVGAREMKARFETASADVSHQLSLAAKEIAHLRAEVAAEKKATDNMRAERDEEHAHYRHLVDKMSLSEFAQLITRP